jgi:hypothetical protein
MDESVARTIIYLGMGIGLLIWLVALRSLRRIVNMPGTTFQETTVDHDLKTTQRALLRAAMNHKSQLSPNGVQVINDDLDFVTFDLSAGTQVICELEETYEGTKIYATADYAHVRRRYQTVMTILVVLVIPIVVVGVGYVLLRYAAPSANPGVRWQCVQILQIAHALWPPFLVSKLFHSNIEHANVFLKNLLVSAKIASDNVPAAG